MALIQLTQGEIHTACIVGCRRRLVSVQSGLKDRAYGHGGWSADIDGALAELAVAKYLGVYWDGGVNTFKAPDVGEFQVRSTAHPHGRLIVRPNDADNEIFVLAVTANISTIDIVGWMSGKEAKQDSFVQKPNGHPPAWFVPQSLLYPLRKEIP